MAAESKLSPLPSSPPPPLRALLLGPAFSPGMVGGLQLALGDVVAQLTGRGWQVDTQISAAPTPGRGAAPAPVAWRSTFTPSALAALQRKRFLLEIWKRALPLPLRRLLSTTFLPRAYFENISHNMYAAGKLLSQAQAYDLVLLCVDGAPEGMSALVAASHPRTAFISLPGLANELAAGWWRWGRLVARWHLRERMHPFLYRRIKPADVRLAVFASAQWHQEAVRAGLPSPKARTIYFGVPQVEPPPRPSQTHNRILWVGRLSPEKGLHLLLRALPAIRSRLGDVTLTAIAGQGSSGYRQLIGEMIKQNRLAESITFHPPMERASLQAAYAAHDVLFFHSLYKDPVALVLMEAFAAGLPVVSSPACPLAGLVRDHLTCLCYHPPNPASLAETIVTMLTSAGLRERVAASAQQLVRQSFSLDRMGQAYDEVIRASLAR